MRAVRRRLCVGSVALGVVVVVEAASAGPAAADLPGAGLLTDPVGTLAGGVAGFTFDKVADGIAHWVLGAVGSFVDGVLGYLTATARPDVGAVWFAGPGSPYATVRNLAVVLLVGFVFLAILQGLLHGDVAGMVRRVALGVPVAVAGMVVTTAVVAHLLELVDALSVAVLAGDDSQVLHFLSGFGSQVISGTDGGFAAVVLGLVAVAAALVLWIELLVRSALVYLLVAISPLGFAAAVWPTARGFLRKTVELLLAVVVSKFVICVALAIGVAALGGSGQAGAGQAAGAALGAGVGALLSGAVLLGLAAFAPFLVLRLIPLAEGALAAQGISRSPLRTAQSGVSTWSSVRLASRLSGPSGGGTTSDPVAVGEQGGAAGGGPAGVAAGVVNGARVVGRTVRGTAHGAADGGKSRPDEGGKR